MMNELIIDFDYSKLTPQDVSNLYSSLHLLGEGVSTVQLHKSIFDLIASLSPQIDFKFDYFMTDDTMIHLSVYSYIITSFWEGFFTYFKATEATVLDNEFFVGEIVELDTGIESFISKLLK